MKVVVTGGAGFIGSHLCKFLLDKGHKVICVDNFFTGRKKNIQKFVGNANFKLIRHDITNPLSVEADQIFNLACPASPRAYQYNAIKTIKTSTVGMINMLDLAKRNRARILQASTSEIYGNPLLHPQNEEYFGNVNPIGMRSCYDEGKRAAECLCMDYHRMDNVDVKIVRIFNTYGPNMSPDDGRVISNFITQALRNEPLTIYGDGHQTRSFQYIDDLIWALYLMMNTEDLIGPVNLGNPEEYSILEISRTIIQMTNSGSKTVFKSLPRDDPLRRCPDIALAVKKLKWKPRVKLIEGLKKTIPYFQEI